MENTIDYAFFRKKDEMPETKLQGIVFGIMMSINMAIGMEIYNVAIKTGYNAMPGGMSNMTDGVL